MKRIIQNSLKGAGIVILYFMFSTYLCANASVCEVTKTNGGGFTTTIQSVVCNTGTNTHTIVLRIEHNGCSGPLCKELSHYSVEADPGTYSNISVQVISGGMTYTNIDLGPNLGASTPFQGFKIDGTDGIGDGQAGIFTITYTLAGGLQDQQVSAKAGTSLQLASFTIADFTYVMTCNNTGCGSIVGPTAIDDNATTPINTPVNITILANDIPGSGALVPSSVTFVSGTAPPPSVGVFTKNSSGLVTFTPATGYTGIATIDYQVCDVNSLCDIAIITVTITPVITGPTAVDDNATTPINTPVNITILSNDIPGSGALVPSSVTFVSGTAPPPSVGVFTKNSSGLVTFTPATGYTGIATIDYQVCDINSLCDIATITVTITPGITGPTAVDDNATTPINTPVNITILANDIPGSGALVPSSVTFVSGTAPPPSVGVFTKNSSGLVTFTPATGYTGIATIDYQVCDVNSLCDIATITVTITGGGGPDTDGDGCPDDVDDYPTDPTRCFDNYFPANGPGTLAYEDLWPGQGDYDFNDLVCDYRFKSVTNAQNKVVEMFGTFIIKAFGAEFENGFGFQLPNNNVNPANVAVTGYDLQEGYITLGANGLEQGQAKPTVIVYDNAYNRMPFPGQGIGVNTTPGAPYVTPDTITVHIGFSSPVYTMAQIDIPNFNPFIIVDLNRGMEVHLPDYLPTSLADPSYYGQAQDDTRPAIGKYYKTVNNLPWAINIYESFAYPKEKVDIVNTYNHFVEWATSGGVQYPDWYMNKPGYRNQSNIYQH